MTLIKNKKVISEGFKVNSQSPIDDRFVYRNLAELNLNLEYYRFYEGLRIWLIEDNLEYIWRENLGAETGLLSSDFTYPSNILLNDVIYSGRSFNFFPTANAINSCLFDAKMETLGSCSGNNILVKNTLEFQPELVDSNLVYFTHTDGGSEVDIITPGVTEITRGLTQPLFNIAAEPSYIPGAPSNTEWNSIYTDPINYGFGTVANLSSRIFGTFADALDNSIGTNIFSTPLIMREISTGRYFAITFTSWTTTSGGGFSYQRQEILNVSPESKLLFADNSTQKRGASNLIAGTGISLSFSMNAENENEITINSLGGDIDLRSALFVATNGDDGTAEPYKLNKPYSSIYTAVSVAAAGDTVIVFPGSYIEFGSLLKKDPVDIIFIGKGEVSGAGHLFNNFGTTVESKVYAPHWKFNATGSVVYLTGPDPINFEFIFDEIVAGGGPHTMLDLTNTKNYTKMIGNRAYASYYGLNLRSMSNGYFNIKSLESGAFNAIFIRPGAAAPQGKAEIYFENLISPTSGIISAQTISPGSNYKCKGKITSSSPTYLLLLQGNGGGVLELDIEMEQQCDNILFYSNGGGGTELILKGKYKSKAKCWQIDSASHIFTLENVKIESTADNLGYINNLKGLLNIKHLVQFKSASGIPSAFLCNVSKVVNQGGSLIFDTNHTIDFDVTNPTTIYNMGNIYLRNGISANFTTLINSTNIINSNISVP